MDPETRFKALIQPIKDIAANWDIDIAESLTEYLDELDNLRISIDGGKSNLNFAEAALLIQGSTAVYSKKVEYLHQLVLQSLEFITNKKSSSTTQGGSKTAKSVDDDDALLFDGDASFLLLDHVIEEGRNINLKAPPPNAAPGRLSHRMSNSFSSADGNTSRVSMSLMQSMLNDDQGTASLKLSTSMVDGSGALLLCGSLPAATGRLSSSSARTSLLNSFQEHSRIHNSSPAGAITTTGAEADERMNVHDDGDDGGYFDDGPGDDWGYEAPDAPVQDADGPAHPFAVSTAPGSPSRLGSANGTNVPHSPMAGGNNVAIGQQPVKARKPVRDIFAQLDPHLVVGGSREARRAKTYRIPAALQRAAPVNPAAPRFDHLYLDLKKSNADILRDECKVPIKGLFNPSLLPILQAKRKQVRRARMLQMRQQRLLQGGAEVEGPDGELRYQNLLLDQGPAVAGGSLNVSRHEMLWSQDYDDGDNDMGGGGGGFDDGGADDGYAFADGPEGDNLGGFSSRRGSSAADVLGDGDGADHGFGDGGGGDNYLQESEEEALARRVAMVLNDELNQSNRSSYESICQKYIANFSNGADAFARETQLSRRVAEWTQRLEPILQQQEEAAQFDIHAYCEQFLEEVDEAIAEHVADSDDDEDGETPGGVSAEGVSFGEVVAGKPSGEVCRIFLACLQLVNHGDVSITPARGVDQWTFTVPAASMAEVHRTARQSLEGRPAAIDPFKVKVNADRHHRRGAALDADGVENYLAPSLQDKLGVPKKSAMKGTNGKGKGTKRVHVDIPSNIFISI